MKYFFPGLVVLLSVFLIDVVEAYADVVWIGNATSTVTSMSSLPVTINASGDAHSLVVCTAKSIVANVQSWSVNTGDTVTEFATNTGSAGIYTDTVAVFGSSATSMTFTATYASSQSPIIACDSFTGANAVPSNSVTTSHTATSSIQGTITTTSASSTVWGAAFRKTGGTNLSPSTDTAYSAAIFAQGSIRYTGDTTVPGTYSMNMTSNVSDTLASVAFEIVPYVAPPPVPALPAATSSVEQSQENLFNATILFFVCMFGTIWIMRKH